MNDLLPYLQHKSFLTKFGTLLVLIALCFVLFSIIGLLLAIPFFGMDAFLNYGRGYDFNDPASLAFLKYLQVVSQIGMFIIPAWFYAYLYNRAPMSYLELKPKISIYPFILSILVIVVSIPFVNFLVSWNEQMSLPEFMAGIERWMRNMENQAVQMTDAFLKVDTVGGLMANLLIIGLLAALGEELLFRGVILKMIHESLKNIHLAVILSALLFSAFHGQFYGFIPRAVLGMLFGYIFVWTGNLWVPIVLHLLFNSVSVVVAYLYENGLMETNYEEFGESVNHWFVLFSLIFTVGLMWALRSKQRSIASGSDES